MTVYYNEIDKYSAQWLENLIAAGLIAAGVVDTRSIEDVRPNDLVGFTQCHFFAGIGGWPLALRRAGWPDDRPIWTGSCPCQPFSAAGQGAGFADQRHLWPVLGYLIKQRRPAIVIGEQVASAAVDNWIDLVHADLEGLGYSFGSVPFPSAGVGAPHIRDRNYWMAHANGGAGAQGSPIVRGRVDGGDAESWSGSGGCGLPDWLGHAHDSGLDKRERERERERERGILGESDGSGKGKTIIGTGFLPGGLADADGGDTSAERQQRSGEQRQFAPDGSNGERMANADGATTTKVYTGNDTQPGERPQDGEGAIIAARSGTRGGVGARDSRPGRTSFGPSRAMAYLGRPNAINGFWNDSDWLRCRDGKWRPVEPSTFPLADGLSSRVGRVRADWHLPAGKEGHGHRAGRLKGYGNAINVEAARAFIEVMMECLT